LKDKAINPSPDDFMINTEKLWAMHHTASHIIDMGRFFPVPELNTYIQHISRYGSSQQYQKIQYRHEYF